MGYKQTAYINIKYMLKANLSSSAITICCFIISVDVDDDAAKEGL